MRDEEEIRERKNEAWGAINSHGVECSCNECIYNLAVVEQLEWILEAGR